MTNSVTKEVSTQGSLIDIRMLLQQCKFFRRCKEWDVRALSHADNNGIQAAANSAKNRPQQLSLCLAVLAEEAGLHCSV